MEPDLTQSAPARQPDGGQLHRAAQPWPSTHLTFLVVAVLVAGWRQRNEYYLTAESGYGYYLGILGGVLMLMLLVYPLRKRLGFMRGWGSVRHWFQLHMVLGVIGPVTILFHSNFSLGSINSTLALFAMLAVAASGIVGRYLYSRIHYGLYGRKAQLNELRLASEAAREPLSYLFELVPEMKVRLEQHERLVAAPSEGFVASVARVLLMAASTKAAHRVCLQMLRPAFEQEATKRDWTRKVREEAYRAARQYLKCHLEAVRRVAEYEFFVRLFGLWHVLHLPLFFLLVVVALVHVLAVHLY